MKNFNTLYYLLTVLLILGGFASMAQNSYGMDILTFVSIAFGLLFLIQFVQQWKMKPRKNRSTTVEFFVLFLLSLIFTLRTFQIHFPYLEWLFVISGIILAFIYYQRMIVHFRQLNPKNHVFGALIIISYSAIILFCMAMVTITFMPGFARFAGLCAFILIISFLAIILFKRHYLIAGDSQAALTLFAGFKDRFFLLASLFLIFSFYLGLTTTGILPKLYSDEYPQAYYKLVSEAETGKLKPVDGTYRYETFKKMYDRFVDRNIKNQPR